MLLGALPCVGAYAEVTGTITPAGNNGASAEVINSSDTDAASVSLILASYEDGALKAVKSDTNEIEAGGTLSLTVTPFSGDDATDDIRAFLWEPGAMRPLTESKIIAEPPPPSEGLTIENGVVTDYNGSDTTVVIPSSFDGAPVTQIGEYAFSASWKKDDIEEVKLPSTVTDISDSAFARCSSLANINLKNVKTIGRSAFSGCQYLMKIDLSGAESLESEAFFNCLSLNEVVLGPKLKELPRQAFGLCMFLNTVYMLNPRMTIDSTAFAGSNNISIYGYEGSTAQTFAAANNFYFEAIDNN